jgi:pectate lyase
MRRRPKGKTLAAVLLAITLFLWIAALLFRLRVINIFDAYLMKCPGPVVIFGAMLIFPLVGLSQGIKMQRSASDAVLGKLFMGMGGVMAAAFVFVIAAPMVASALGPKPPKNPDSPRPVPPQVGLPVFPGAEGFGTRTKAGRGGEVIPVTSLADDGPGTLRAAVETPSPRVIIFRIGGTITLQSPLQILHPYLTIAGQTAPGGGICVKGAGLEIMTHDVLIQHLRVRPGNEGPVDADVNDAIAILGKHGDVEGAYNVVIDHVSASWGEDETISTWYGAHDITISWSIISEALDESRHRKVTHSAGLLIGDSSYHVSVHHNLLAHNDFRNPLVSEGGTHDFVNNVIYDWGILAGEIVDVDSNTFLNFIGNTFLPGPSTVEGPYEILFDGGDPRIFVADNYGPHRPDPSFDEWALVGLGYGEGGTAPTTYRSMTPFASSPIAPDKASAALELVLAGAGATLPERDAVDQRLVREVREGGGAIIDSPEEVGGYPTLAMGSAEADLDGDGIPDEWEAELGLDPLDPSDGNADSDGDGYTNIEAYLHLLREQ